MKRATRLPAQFGRLRAPFGRLPAPLAGLAGRARRRQTVRLLAVAAAITGTSLSLSACDASPYAATVNGDTISQVTLNHQLAEWSSNRTWVTSFDNANATSNGGTGVTVTGTGGAGTYSSAFVADILANMVQTSIIHQHLSATGNLPTADEVTASRAVNEYLRSAYWDAFSPGLRQVLVTQLAEEAVLTPVSTNTAQLQSAFSAIQPYLVSQVCVHQATAFSQAAAARIEASGYVGGSVDCYSQDQLEAQPGAYQAAIQKLRPNQISAPVKMPFGYVVLQLSSRRSPGLSTGVRKVLSVAIASSSPAQVSALVNKASVKINPTYGTWSQGRITPPTTSGT